MLGGKRRPSGRSFASPWPSSRPVLVWPMMQILVVELLNSALEAVVDRSGLERHPLAGMAKDMGSAAVLLSFALLGTVWVLILSDH
jgi:diacylglycerol kinase (ATP)